MTSTTKKKSGALDLEAPDSQETRPRFITAYGPKLRVRFSDSTPSRTKQQFAEECDINNIMARYQITGLITHENRRPAIYADVSGVDYQAAQNLIAAANSEFQALPSAIRNEFENSPAKFLDFCQDEANFPRMAELGLLSAEGTEKWINLQKQQVIPKKEPEPPANGQ